MRFSNRFYKACWRIVMKSTINILILLLFGSLYAGTAIAQKLYKSVLPDGRIVYSDSPPTEGRIDKTLNFDNLPSSALPASASSYVAQLRRLRAATAPAVASDSVVLYAAVWCGYCRQAKAWLASKGVAYREYDIDTRDGMTALVDAGGGKGIPLLVAGGQRIRGFSAQGYEQFFSGRK
jgi:glutaredoxin